jgi:hypothetical protein
MNINPLIEKAFENYKIPIEYMTFTGKADTYLTYYTWKEEPDDFCDDENNIEVAFGTIDIFSKGNFKDILKDVKNILKSDGSPEYTGIEYKSVMHPEGYNLALFDPDLFECVGTKIYGIDTVDYRKHPL